MGSLQQQPPVATPQELVARLARFVAPGHRSILGITGPPGAGKSTLAAALCSGLGSGAALVPMDGFHLAQPELERLDRQARKGAPDTFDAGGYAALLERLRAQRATDPAVYAPQFRREIEEPIAGAIGIFGVTPLVITEGNYLLFEQHGWSGVRPLLDEVWYVDLDDHRRHQRLIARHMAHGRSPAEAAIWALGNDQINAELVAATRRLADLVVAMA